jgi:hypothetical protein
MRIRGAGKEKIVPNIPELSAKRILWYGIQEKTLDSAERWFIVADTNVRNRIGHPNSSGTATIVRFLGIVTL